MAAEVKYMPDLRLKPSPWPGSSAGAKHERSPGRGGPVSFGIEQVIIDIVGAVLPAGGEWKSLERTFTKRSTTGSMFNRGNLLRSIKAHSNGE